MAISRGLFIVILGFAVLGFSQQGTFPGGAKNAARVGSENQEREHRRELERLLDIRAESESETSVWDEWIVVWDNGTRGKTGASAFGARLEKTVAGARTLSMVAGKRNRWYAKMKLPEPCTPGSVQVNKLGGVSGVLSISPNYRRKLFDTPDDPLFAQQWSLNNTGQSGGESGADIRAVEAWDIQSGSEEVVIAIVDTGVAYDHPDLAANIWRNPGEVPANGLDDDGNGYVDDVVGYDFGEMDGDPYDRVGHGSHVAGIAGAVGGNGLGIAGVSRRVSIMVVKIAEASGALTDFGIIESLQYAGAMGARVINASWGSTQFSEALKSAIEDLASANVLFVAAAGNSSASLEALPFYPAAFDVGNIVTVAATNDMDRLADFSTHSSLRVDLAAPGQGILSTQFLEDVLFAEDFQSVQPPDLPGSLAVGGTPSHWATVLSETRGGPGNRALRPDAESEPYRGGVSSTLRFPVMVLDEGFDFSLQFNFAQQLGSGDRFFIEFLDGASMELRSQWILFDGEDTENYTAARIPLPAIDSVQIVFRWETDETDNDAFGLELDDIQLRRTAYTLQPEPSGEPTYATFSGTSMAAPHVAGAAALLLAQNPDMSLNEIRMRLAGSGERLSQLENGVLLGRRLDLVNALTATGPLRLDINIRDGEWEVSEPVVLDWTFFDQPDCPADITLLRDGETVGTIAQQYTGPPSIVWRVPLLDPGDGYRIRLTACGQTVSTEAHSLLETQFLKVEDPQFMAFAREHIDADGDGRISAFEAGSVTALECSNRNIERLPDLAMFTSLAYLDCSGNNLRELPELAHLPLSTLSCAQNKLTGLPELPSTLQSLILNDNFLAELPDLSGFDFHELNVDNNLLTELVGPISASRLRVAGNRLTRLPELAPGLGVLNCRHNLLESLPAIPDSLATLTADYNRLTELPELHDGLSSLRVSGNLITGPPVTGWPEDLLFIDCSENPFAEAPDFSMLPRLRHLFAKNMGLTEIPRIPTGEDQNLFVVHANGNRFDADDCPDIAEIDALGITDPPIFEGNALDGWLVNLQEDGTTLNCDGVVHPLTEIEGPWLETATGAPVLRWRGGGGRDLPIHAYEVIVNGAVAGVTGELRFPLKNVVPGRPFNARILAYHREIAVAGSLEQAFEVPSLPSYRRLFKLPEPGSGDWFGLVFANAGLQAASIEMVARGSDNRELARRVLDPVLSGHKRIGLLESFFPNEATADATYLEILSEQELAIMAIFGNREQVGGGSGNEPGTEAELVLPDFLHRFGARSLIGLIAPQPTEVVLHAFDPLGNALGSFEGELEGSAVRTLDALFPGVAEDRIRLVTGAFSEPCALYQDNFDNRDLPIIARLSGKRTPSLEGVLLGGENSVSRLVHLSVANPNPFRVFVDFDVYTRSGDRDRNLTLRLEPHETRWYTSTYLFLDARVNPMVSYRATAPVSMDLRLNRFSSGSILPPSRPGLERLPAATALGEAFLVPHLPYNQGWWTELAVQNAGDEDRAVVFRVTDGAGNLLETRQFTVPAKGVMRDFTQNLFESAPFAGTLEIDAGPGAELAVWCFLHPATGESLTGFLIPPKP